MIKTFLNWLNKPRYVEFGQLECTPAAAIKHETSLDLLIKKAQARKLERKRFAEGLIVGGLSENYRVEGLSPEVAYQEATHKLMDLYANGDINQFGTLELIADEVA